MSVDSSTNGNSSCSANVVGTSTEQMSYGDAEVVDHADEFAFVVEFHEFAGPRDSLILVINDDARESLHHVDESEVGTISLSRARAEGLMPGAGFLALRMRDGVAEESGKRVRA